MEAPYRGRVIEEHILSNGRSITYETIGLIFHKVVEEQDSELLISYRVEPRPGVKIKSIEIPIWQAWGTQVSSVEIEKSTALMVSDHGSVIVRADEDSKLEYGLDPEFKAPRLLVAKNATGKTLEVSIKIKTLNHLSSISYEYLATTRPEMEKGDRVNIIVETIDFKPVYQTKKLAIYEIIYPESTHVK